MTNGIVIGIDPMIGSLGPFMLRWYSLFFALAVLAGVWLGVREAVRKGFDADHIQALAMWSLAGGFVGARLFHVIDRWDLYAADPLRILNLWEGGLAVYGGLIGGFLTGLVYALRAGLAPWKLADAAAPGMLLGQTVGRLACIPNGDAYGAPANVPWAFIYTNPMAMLPSQWLGVPLHPYPVYELLFDAALLGVLWRLRSVLKMDGLLFLIYVAAYGIGRFLLTYYRVEAVWFWGLQEAQVIALALVLATLPLLAWRLWAASGAPRMAARAAGQPA